MERLDTKSEDPRLAKAKQFAEEIREIRKKDGSSPYDATVKFLNTKQYLTSADREFYFSAIMSIMGSRGAATAKANRAAEKQRKQEVEDMLASFKASREKQELERLARAKAEKESLPLLRHAGLLDDDKRSGFKDNL